MQQRTTSNHVPRRRAEPLDVSPVTLTAKVPDASEKLRVQICGFTQGLREFDLFKPPGMAETLDWAQALLALGTTELNAGAVDDTLGVILKYQEDVERVRGDASAQLIERAARATANN